MKTKNSNPEVDDARRQFGDLQNDGTELSVPSAEGHPGVVTEPTSDEEISSNTENVTPEWGEILDDSVPSNPALASHFESQGFSSEFAAYEAKNWTRRLEKEFHFEIFPGGYDVDYSLLFYRGRNILVSAVDAARAATCGAGLGSQIQYTDAEFIRTLDAREVIKVPGPEIPANLEGAVEGTYIPLESLCVILHDSKMGYDASEFGILLSEFADNQEYLQEEMLRERRLRKARLKQAFEKGYWLQRTKDREERSRKAKLRNARAKEGRPQEAKTRKEKLCSGRRKL